VVPDRVKTQLGYAASDNTTFTRLGGAHRYETSALIADYAQRVSTNLSLHQVAVATGQKFPDALAGGAFAGKVGTVLLLVDDSTAGRSQIATVINANKDRIGYGYVLGGTAVISDALKADLETASQG
jgi:putative cell wall-binding protein